MCQSIQYIYKFCNCPGELFEQTCPKPTTTCKLLRANPQPLKLTCYCERHSSQPFETVRQDQRATARFTREYNKILAREEEEQRRERERDSAHRRPSERQEQIFREHGASIRQRQSRVAERRQQEREVEKYGEKWGQRAMRRKFPVARDRYEDLKRREKQEREIAKKAGGKGEGGCVVM